LPKIVETGPGRDLHCRAALAATFIAGLELTRGGAVTLEQDTSWESIEVRRRGMQADQVKAPNHPIAG
jgi:chromatin segregation and condensation protein Rec8/ScpA/Scc1 (kleisin family)